MDDVFRRRITQNVGFAVLLTAVAGYVDLVGYVALFHVFTANMTGNTIAIANGVIDGNIGLALRRGFAIPMFVLGAIFSRLWVHVAGRQRLRSVAAGLFAVEALALGALLVLGQGGIPSRAADAAASGRLWLLVGLPAFAMGLQNSTLTHFGPLDMRTTHVTGNLAKLADAAARFLIWLAGRMRSGRPMAAWQGSMRQESFREGLLLAGVWVSYLAGGFAGAYGYANWELDCVLAPIAGLVGLVVVDLAWPMLRTGHGR